MDVLNDGIEFAMLMYSQNIAIVESNQSMSYYEMNRFIEQITHKIELFSNGKIQGKIVGIYMTSSTTAVIAQLAIIRCGGICMPLDRQTPLSYYSLEKYEDIACLLTDTLEVENNFCFPVINLIECLGMLQSETISTYKACRYSSTYSHCIMTSGTRL